MPYALWSDNKGDDKSMMTINGTKVDASSGSIMYGLNTEEMDQLQRKYLKNFEIQEGACTFSPQTLNMIEQLSAEPVQQKTRVKRESFNFCQG